jgi:hypothetical protein
MYQDAYRSYKTASKSVKDQKALEILQGLNQIYTLQDICENFIFVVITSILAETFSFTLQDLEAIENHLAQLKSKNPAEMTNDEKLRFLQSINFLMQLLTIAKSNTKEKPVLEKIKQLMKELEVLQMRILEDPWIRTILKVDSIKVNIKLDMAGASKDNKLSIFEALGFLIKFFWTTLCDAVKKIWHDYKI